MRWDGGGVILVLVVESGERLFKERLKAVVAERVRASTEVGSVTGAGARAFGSFGACWCRTMMQFAAGVLWAAVCAGSCRSRVARDGDSRRSPKNGVPKRRVLSEAECAE